MRHAYFYPPPPPPTLELPADREGPTLIRRACLLGAVWVETPRRDSVAGTELARRPGARRVAGNLRLDPTGPTGELAMLEPLERGFDLTGMCGGGIDEVVARGEPFPRAPEARRKAIAYYRQAFALDRTSGRARRAWTEAWRLVAGLPPGRTHFFCVYD
ncbi:MAG: hypothetical protein ACREMJ_04365 [Gemmatimonadales bacterium]